MKRLIHRRRRKHQLYSASISRALVELLKVYALTNVFMIGAVIVRVEKVPQPASFILICAATVAGVSGATVFRDTVLPPPRSGRKARMGTAVLFGALFLTIPVAFGSVLWALHVALKISFPDMWTALGIR